MTNVIIFPSTKSRAAELVARINATDFGQVRKGKQKFYQNRYRAAPQKAAHNEGELK